MFSANLSRNVRCYQVESSMFSISYNYRPPTDFGAGREGVRALVQRMRTAFPDYHEEVRCMLAEGEFVAAWYTLTGTHQGPLEAPALGCLPPTGKPFAVEEIAIFRVRDGKVVEQRGVVEVLPLLQQLGLLATLTQEHA